MNYLKSCFIFLLLVTLTAGCATDGTETRTEEGALAGALGGAALGGLIGSKGGKAGQGALIGGLVGALGGGLIGNYMDKQAAELEKVADTRRTEDGILVTMHDKILFDVDKSELKPEAKTALAKIAEVLKKYPKTDITVAGYTDNTGKQKHNEELSEKRAGSVRFFLVDNGVKSGRITAKGFGSDIPSETTARRKAGLKTAGWNFTLFPMMIWFRKRKKNRNRWASGPERLA